jgi:hypothetical protein
MADTDDISPTEGPVTQQDAALDALSRDEDATRYIEQRRDDLREEQGLEPETPADERENRIDQALRRAREDTAKARQTNGNGLDLDQQYQNAAQEYAQQQAAEQQAAQQQALQQQYYEARGRTMAKAEALRQSNPQMHAKITENLTTLGDVLDDQQGAALEHALVMHPEAIWILAARLSNDSDGTTMADKMAIVQNSTPQQIFQAAMQCTANLQQERYIQTRIMQDRVQQGRRITQAPPPITPPRGGAGVPKDLFKLAEKPSVDDYVKMRRAQMARQDDR